jgi:hypothetical protein
MELFIRVLTAILWMAAAIFVGAMVLSGFSYELMLGMLGDRGIRLLTGVSLSVVLICSAALAGYEFWKNPSDEGKRGEWTGRQQFYTLIFACALLMSGFYIPAMFFSPSP